MEQRELAGLFSFLYVTARILEQQESHERGESSGGDRGVWEGGRLSWQLSPHAPISPLSPQWGLASSTSTVSLPERQREKRDRKSEAKREGTRRRGVCGKAVAKKERAPAPPQIWWDWWGVGTADWGARSGPEPDRLRPLLEN